MKPRPIAGAALLFALILAFACNGDGQAQPTPSPTARPFTLPESFPADFPVYPNATIVGGFQLDSLINAQFETNDPRVQVADFYQQALAQDPWRIINVEEPRGQDTTLMTFDNRDDPNTGGTLAIRTETTNGQNTLIIVSIMPPGPA